MKNRSDRDCSKISKTKKRVPTRKDDNDSGSNSLKGNEKDGSKISKTKNRDDNSGSMKSKGDQVTFGLADHSPVMTEASLEPKPPSNPTGAAATKTSKLSKSSITNNLLAKQKKTNVVAKTDAGHRLRWYPYMKMGIRKLDEHPKIKKFFAMMLDATTAIVDRHLHAGPGLGRERHCKIFNDDVRNSIFSMNVCRYLGANLTRCETSDVFKKSVAKDMADNHPNSVLEHMGDEKPS